MSDKDVANIARLHVDAARAWKVHIQTHGEEWRAVAAAGGTTDDYNAAVQSWYRRERELADAKAGTWDDLVREVEEENASADAQAKVGELEVRAVPGTGENPGVEDGL